jgi:hypothetical protein
MIDSHDKPLGLTKRSQLLEEQRGGVLYAVVTGARRLARLSSSKGMLCLTCQQMA